MPNQPESSKPLTVRDLLLLSSNYLSEHNVPHARREAECLVAELLGTSRLDVYLHFEDEVPESGRDRLREMIRRRAKREPRAYVIGHADFMGERYKITPEVLVPRPETEVLASIVLERFPSDSAIRIADVGTGSGVLAGSLLKGFPNASAVATDVSEKALTIARENLTRLGVIARVALIHCNLLPESIAPFDLIAANLPYVSEADYLRAEPEVKAEPKSALVPGPLGTELISALVKRAPAVLKPGGWLALEVGYNQSREVEKTLHAAGLTEVFVEEDLAGIPRVVGGMLPK